MANARAKPKNSSAKASHKVGKGPTKVAKASSKVARAPARIEKAPIKVESVAKAANTVTVVPRMAKPERTADKVDITVSAQPEPFRLATIERAEPPAGAAGKNWYRYTIRQGANAINGYLQGTAAGVKTAAEQIVGQLNERRAGRWGYRTTRAAAPAPTTT